MTLAQRAGRAQVHRARATLEVDRIRCDGFGLCAELLPELIELDDWGYPILREPVVPAELMDHARRAEQACPVLALRLGAPKSHRSEVMP
jgi:ferredoxin